MSKPTEPAGEVAPPAVDEDQAIRKRVQELTSQVLQQGHIDTEGVRDVVRAMTGFGAANRKWQAPTPGRCWPMPCGISTRRFCNQLMQRILP